MQNAECRIKGKSEEAIAILIPSIGSPALIKMNDGGRDTPARQAVALAKTGPARNASPTKVSGPPKNVAMFLKPGNRPDCDTDADTEYRLES